MDLKSGFMASKSENQCLFEKNPSKGHTPLHPSPQKAGSYKEAKQSIRDEKALSLDGAAESMPRKVGDKPSQHECFIPR